MQTYVSGRVYEGSWHEDKRHGKGYEMFRSGNVYKGDFVMNRAHGQGTFLW